MEEGPKAGSVILLFGLSADPPTGMGGHAGLVTWGAQSARVLVDGALRAVDEVWVLPVFQHAFSEKRQMTPYPNRLAMARLAFKHLPGLEGRVKVMETEREVTESKKVAGLVGTLDVLEALQATHPEVHFAVLMGGDTYRDYHAGMWKGGRELEKRAPIVAVPRLGVETQDLSTGPSLSNVSSRTLRASDDAAFWEREVQPEVRQYVLAHRLYRIGERPGETWADWKGRPIRVPATAISLAWTAALLVGIFSSGAFGRFLRAVDERRPLSDPFAAGQQYGNQFESKYCIRGAFDREEREEKQSTDGTDAFVRGCLATAKPSSTLCQGSPRSMDAFDHEFSAYPWIHNLCELHSQFHKVECWRFARIVAEDCIRSGAARDSNEAQP